jgi:hypothetical protein
LPFSLKKQIQIPPTQFPGYWAELPRGILAPNPTTELDSNQYFLRAPVPSVVKDFAIGPSREFFPCPRGQRFSQFDLPSPSKPSRFQPKRVKRQTFADVKFLPLILIQRRDATMSTIDNATTAGISMGSALAMILSFQLNHSILWAIIHGVCSWFYVIYRAIRGNY